MKLQNTYTEPKHKQLAIGFLIIFYSVGIVGLSWSFSRELFIRLIPLNLLLSATILFFFEKNKDLRLFLQFTVVYVFTWLVEFVGTKTGMLFGEYYYQHGLGPKVLDTPLLIGVNWFILAYGFWVYLQKTHWPAMLKIVAASVLMVGYDIVLEPNAIEFQMWYWTAPTVPIQNYVMWFVISLIVFTFFYFTKAQFKNPLAFPMVLIQFVFFSVLYFIN